MEYHWILPPLEVVKINVHGAISFIPFPNDNTNGIGVIFRNSEGELLKLAIGTLPASSRLENKLNAIHFGLVHGFEDNYKDVILETDNLDAFKVLKNFPHNTPPEVAEVAQQISIRLNGPRWTCTIVFIYSERNSLAIYLAKLGAEKCKKLYTLTRPIRAIEELLSLDLGFGHTALEFRDVEIFNDEPDPMNFGPNQIPGISHDRYAFHEDFHAVENDLHDGPIILPMHEDVMEDYIFGTGEQLYHLQEMVSRYQS